MTGKFFKVIGNPMMVLSVYLYLQICLGLVRMMTFVKEEKYSGNDITYLNDKNIPADDIALGLIADQILNKTPKQGYLTISNA